MYHCAYHRTTCIIVLTIAHSITSPHVSLCLPSHIASHHHMYHCAYHRA
ncbi:hypothetical protein NP493_1924g00000 [Ridgeia piscesae]|uniref:Uncharacterized protein n=1 Tax=Ridgeia piscesae TaxID=27915 RepID=A0AAD9JP80_RIDPI|nr:hypothetical protein NP493_1924g00000 [Ridgeia piscesae]